MLWTSCECWRYPPKGPQLYCKHVLVVDDCRELLPDYLRFVRGIVDASDLPLNISRETLQHDAQMQVIKNHLEKKVLERLKGMLADERSKYEAFWNELGKSIKGGLFMDYRNTEKLQDLLIFESAAIHAGDAERQGQGSATLQAFEIESSVFGQQRLRLQPEHGAFDGGSQSADPASYQNS